MDQQTLIIVVIAIVVIFFIINSKNEEKENFIYINPEWKNNSGLPRPTSPPAPAGFEGLERGARGPNNDSKLCCALDFLDYEYNPVTNERSPQFDEKDAPDWDYEKNYQGANDRLSLLKLKHWKNVIRPLAGCPTSSDWMKDWTTGEGPICKYDFWTEYCKLDHSNKDKARYNCLWGNEGDIKTKIKKAAGCNWGWDRINSSIIRENNKICKKYRTNTAMLPDPTPSPAPTPPPPPPPPPAPPVEISFADWHFRNAPRIGGFDGPLPRRLSEKECCDKHWYKNERGDCEQCPAGTWTPTSYYKEDIKQCTNNGISGCKPIPPCTYWNGAEYQKLTCPPGEYCPISGKDKGKCVPKPTLKTQPKIKIQPKKQ